MIIRDEDIVELFFQVTKLNQRYSDNNLGNRNPFRGQYHCLLVLDRQKKMTSKELVSALRIRPSSVSEILMKLEQKGFITRHVSEADKRVTHISLTTEGKKEAENTRKKKALAHVEMLSDLSSVEKKQFAHALTKIKGFYLDMGEQEFD